MSKLLLSVKYLKYLFLSTTKHGVHSPFIYDLVTKVFNDKGYKKEYEKIHQIKGANLSYPNVKRLKLIYRITNYLQSINLLEIGNSKELEPLFLTNTQTKVNVSYFKTVPTMESELGTRRSSLTKKFDFIFLKPQIHEEKIIDNFENCLKYTHNNSIMIISNIHKSQEMEKAWNQIIKHKDVKVSVDLFYTGIMFFRKEQVKENFIIRF
jgi:hypothetical protein